MPEVRVEDQCVTCLSSHDDFIGVVSAGLGEVSRYCGRTDMRTRYDTSGAVHRDEVVEHPQHR